MPLGYVDKNGKIPWPFYLTVTHFCWLYVVAIAIIITFGWLVVAPLHVAHSGVWR